ncbi:hypothetical protein ART_2725 [Arthrobacter sp. PAMC 25486]|nr:hypothetical protein ART_2725 [Arthrobacter sp. PAMC 25486]
MGPRREGSAVGHEQWGGLESGKSDGGTWLCGNPTSAGGLGRQWAGQGGDNPTFHSPAGMMVSRVRPGKN